jgi:catechol 2,3-dioxygenase-like lactoylglutathione lyase family enzyme
MVDMRLEVDIIPVSDVDRSTQFYESLGWRKDATPPGVVQFTPPGSWCSVQFGPNLTSAAPGSAKGYLIVDDIDVARDKLNSANIPVSDAYHIGQNGKESGVDPDHNSYRSFIAFSDPDGNKWVFQEITTRLPGRIQADETTFSSASDLADAMRRASSAHGKHEERTGKADANWPDWYASYMVAEEAGAPLPT